MGFISDAVKKVGNAVGDVVDGIVDGIDKVFGVDLKKILSKDWVQTGLMAVSIMTGGVAIVNGVMQGFNAASAASGFMGKFVEGAGGFIKGVSAGLSNPMDVAGDIGGKMLGTANDALSGVMGAADTAAGAAQTPGSMLAEGGGQAQNVLTDAGAGLDDIASQGVSGEGLAQGADMSGATQGFEASGPMPEGLDPTGMGGPSDAMGMADPSMGAPDPTMGADPYGVNASMQDPAMAGMGPQDMNMGGPDQWGADQWGGDVNMTDMGAQPVDAMQAQMNANAAPEGFLGKLAKGATDFATSPKGMMTAAQMVSGWAKGQAIEERWEEMEKNEKRRRKSFDGFADRAPTFDIPSLQKLRARTQEVHKRGQKAQKRYGYGK